MTESSDFPRINKPCPSCPWRKNKTAADIPNFSLEMAENLSGCCPDSRGMGPSFGDSLFACHQSIQGQEFACAGWLASVGHAHPNVRFAVATGRLSAEALTPGENWPELHESFNEVIDKLRGNSSGVKHN